MAHRDHPRVVSAGAAGRVTTRRLPRGLVSVRRQSGVDPVAARRGRPVGGRYSGMDRHLTPATPGGRLRAAAVGGAAALLLLTACGPDGEAPPAGAGATGEADATVSEPAAAAPGTPGGGADAADDAEAAVLEGVTDGETRLALDAGFLGTLRTLQVDVEPVPPATLDGSTFVFPVTGGDVTVDPAAADPFTGRLEHQGGLSLSALGRSVEFTALVVDATQGEVTAEVQGRRVPLLALGDGQADVARQASGFLVSGEAATLTTEAVETLGDRLGVPVPQVRLGDVEVALPGS